jgi:xanthine dehydrogenase molybdopterin-binding subunit B
MWAEAVVVVIAESVHAARDGSEAVKVEYRVLPAVTDALAALASSDDCGWNSRFVPQKNKWLS